jgi:hypothetical protein
MILQLIKWECTYWIKNFLYYAFLSVLIGFMISQAGVIDIAQRSSQMSVDGQFQGILSEEDEMITYLGTLIFDYNENSFAIYPNGVYRSIALKDHQKIKIENIFQQITQLSLSDLIKQIKEDDALIDGTDSALDIFKHTMETYNIHIGVTYSEFVELMDEVDETIGGNSFYDQDTKKNIDTYRSPQEASAAYNSIVYKDKISNAYARVFCDYATIILTILPIFLVVSRCLKDKNNHMDSVVFSKKANSITIVASRFIAIIIMIMLPMIFLSLPYLIVCAINGTKLGVSVDLFAYLRYIMIWILPTVLFVSAFGFFITELTNNIVAIIFQVCIWIKSVFINDGNLVGNYGFNIAPRFNVVGEYEVFKLYFSDFLINRAFYLCLSILLFMVTVYIYKWKRKGGTIISGKNIRSGA